jgi:adenylate cyclase
LPTIRLDPTPRSYVDSVTLYARSNRGPVVAEGVESADDIRDWLLGKAIETTSMMDLVEGFCWRLVAAGLPVHRAALSAGTLHPQLVGSSWIWQANDGFCDELRVSRTTLSSRAYIRSPLYRAIVLGETVHLDPRDPAMAKRYPILQDLAKEGMADYLIMPLTSGDGSRQDRMSLSLSSAKADGLSGPTFEVIRQLLHLMTPHVARLMATQVTRNIARAYLGEEAAGQVLEGSIERGAGAAIEAVILLSDLRDSTGLSTQLPPESMLALLNAYFECLTEAIEAEGGEVLKFIGDGLLAVFPISDHKRAGDAANRAYAAAAQALARIADIAANPPALLQNIDGWQPVGAGLALHMGEVFFGNVGSKTRLDFTVIGPAVNVAARVESLTKELQRPLLVTAPVAALLNCKLDALGSFDLRGIRQPISVFAPPLTDRDRN